MPHGSGPLDVDYDERAAYYQATAGLSQGESARRLRELEAAGLLPPHLAAIVGPDGNVYVTPPGSEGEQPFPGTFFWELRPYLVGGGGPPAPPAPGSPIVPSISVYSFLPPAAGGPPAVGPAGVPAGGGVPAKGGPRFAAPIAPVPGDPVTFAITAILSIISSLFGLFRGGANKNIADAFSGVRSAIAQVSDRLMRFAWWIARGVGWLLRAVQALWVRVLRPMLDYLRQLAEWMRRKIDFILRHYFRWISKIQEHLLRIYERFVRPVIVAIQRLRQMLYVLRLLRIRWAEKLDAELARIQNAISGALLDILRAVNFLGSWVNILVSARGLLQEPMLVNSVAEFRDDLAQLLAGTITGGISGSDVVALQRAGAARPYTETLDGARAGMVERGGPYGAAIAAAVDIARSRYRAA